MNKNNYNNIQTEFDWQHILPKLISKMGSKDFLGDLSEILQSISPYGSSVVFGYFKASSPILLYSDLSDREQHSTLEMYLRGGYLLDPYYAAIQQGVPEGIYQLTELAPDDFFQTEYYLNYYQATGLKDEQGVIIHLSDEVSVVISLGLRDDFTEDIDEPFQAVEPIKFILLELIKKHFQLYDLQSLITDQQSTKDKKFSNNLNKAFNNFGREVLSEREREIVLFILKGYSSKAIAKSLDISLETVKVHRKKIHSKLNISSQAELFSLFIVSLPMLDKDADADPLALYLSKFED
ncbi:transcriptional regulator, luxR family [Shewanella psychrophila]|uniref:Transcriptional regulator, luxR family n=1 Tax=Shewanella psychrophila TaxID=225848 RepID=A0A1S6HU13_9GAMM|nr:helix-turn-helix transcriptional regulator [Shewanella psychrophila]AQS39057.1 transcriptional regulator, luxR family [Shewanella psychrophila]